VLIGKLCQEPLTLMPLIARCRPGRPEGSRRLPPAAIRGRHLLSPGLSDVP
jgi:hypothetical protein